MYSKSDVVIIIICHFCSYEISYVYSVVVKISLCTRFNLFNIKNYFLGKLAQTLRG